MKMGKIIGITLLCVAAFTFLTGCVLSDDKADAEVTDMSLDDVVDRLIEGVDVPSFDVVELNKDNFEFFAFAPYEDGITAVACDALVNITPHSLVVIHTNGGNAEDLADKIFKNADPNKWLCVGSDVVNVANTDHYVVLVMSFRDVADDIISNFDKLSSELNDGTFRSLTAENTIRVNY